MQRFQTHMKWLTAFSLIALLASLAGVFLNIYYSGKARILEAGKAAIPSIYQWDDVCNRLSDLFPPFMMVVLLIVLTTVLCKGCSSSNPARNSTALYHRNENVGNLQFSRYALMLLAVILIVLGVMNGGLRDVFVKAINICTECIGLG